SCKPGGYFAKAMQKRADRASGQAEAIANHNHHSPTSNRSAESLHPSTTLSAVPGRSKPIESLGG
ncbi:hypothetical protein HKX48_003244, partial [Thoreauomyces humboldtii]